MDYNIKIFAVSLVGSCLDEGLKKNNFDIEIVCSNVVGKLTPTPVNLHFKEGIVP